MDLVFKALADPVRRRMLDRLRAENGQTLTELCARVAMTRQGVAKHLALLEAANLVVTVWRGREKYHYLNPVPIQGIASRWIGKYERAPLRALDDLKRILEEEHHGKREQQAVARLRHLHRYHARKTLARAHG